MGGIEFSPVGYYLLVEILEFESGGNMAGNIHESEPPRRRPHLEVASWIAGIVAAIASIVSLANFFYGKDSMGFESTEEKRPAKNAGYSADDIAVLREGEKSAMRFIELISGSADYLVTKEGIDESANLFAYPFQMSGRIISSRQAFVDEISNQAANDAAEGRGGLQVRGSESFFI